ncbi:MAG: NAD-binding protein [Cyanobacteria bacterium P01_D01_bin.105]
MSINTPENLPTSSNGPTPPAGYSANYPAGPETLMPSLTSKAPAAPDRFIICGLGNLGQQCVLNLKKFDYDPFEVHITAIDQRNIQSWEVDNLPNYLVKPPLLGDCRREDMLKAAGVESARAVLVVTSNESTNVECAIAVRRLNPNVQIIMRSSRHSLNALLSRQLGKFVALDATELPAMTFALAGLDEDVVSVFKIGRHRFRVTERIMSAGDSNFCQQRMQDLHKGNLRLLDFNPVENPPQPMGWATTASSIFHRWQPYLRVSPGDRVAYIEVDNGNEPKTQPQNPLLAFTYWLEELRHGNWQQRLRNWRKSSEESLGRVVAIALLTAVVLWLTGTLLLKFSYSLPPNAPPDLAPELSWVKAISLGAILLLGGYGDVFGGFTQSGTPAWVQMACLIITLISILVVLGVLGLVAERLLNSRFDFLQKRPRTPRKDHVVVVGLGRIGRKVATLLSDLNQPLVALDTQPNTTEIPPQIPLLAGSILEELPMANLAAAKSVIAVTNDQMLNLEIALFATEKNLNRTFSPVVRTRSQSFSDNLAAMMPQAQTFCAYALSAEAFAGAAFGENIIGLFRLGGQNILIAEYLITQGDTLSGKQMAQVTYGYGVVPILRETLDDQGNRCTVLMPTDEQYLRAGDRLFLLSSINGLRRIERGATTPPRRWRLVADTAAYDRIAPEALNNAALLLTKFLDCEEIRARQFVEQLPAAMDIDLYDYQAARLVQAMQKRLPIRLSPL